MAFFENIIFYQVKGQKQFFEGIGCDVTKINLFKVGVPHADFLHFLHAARPNIQEKTFENSFYQSAPLPNQVVSSRLGSFLEE